MNPKTVLVALVLLAFGGFSMFVMWEIGYLGIWQAGISGLGEMQVLVDLVIACAIIGMWMLVDAPERGISPWPYLALVLVGGSLGVLVYLLRRGLARRLPLQTA